TGPGRPGSGPLVPPAGPEGGGFHGEGQGRPGPRRGSPGAIPANTRGAMMADLRLDMLAAGTLRCKVHNINMNQGLGQPYESPAPGFVSNRPRGNVIIDGGTAVECAADPRGHWGDAVEVKQADQAISSAIGRAGGRIGYGLPSGS